MKPVLILFLLFFLSFSNFSQTKKIYSQADSLKGFYSDKRDWWDVTHYSLNVEFNIEEKTISGINAISYKVLRPSQILQIDLLEPLILDSVIQNKLKQSVTKDGSAYFVKLSSNQELNSNQKLICYYHGKPVQAKNAPWDGGVVWSKDAYNRDWISIACQGMAARAWYPNKDHMADEPDSADMKFRAGQMPIISNGKLLSIEMVNNKLQFHWRVKNPINNYNIIPYIGSYTNIKDSLIGKNGILEINYWVLNENYNKAKTHFVDVKRMLHCFEDWFGPYPFYEDGYKLVEAPYLGMEHQSAIAYGNNYMNGYRGRDLSETGLGLNWDFIIVHESGHEWFGNNISAKDVADDWIHESFTAYAENLFVENIYGKKGGAAYVIGTRKAIKNKETIIANYDVNEGSAGDLYYKGANMLHTIRQLVNNDSLWKKSLQGLNKKFWHQTVTTKQIENYMSEFLKIDLSKVFDQYLRTTQIPTLQYYLKKHKLFFKWTNCLPNFNMPLKIDDASNPIWIKPTTQWQKIILSDTKLKVNENFYVFIKEGK